MIPGVDVHAGYGLISWTLVASAGIRFAYIKCSQGNERPGKDLQFARNVMQAKANGILVGAYHYAYCLPPHPDHPFRSPVDEAHFAFESCQGLGSKAGELSPAVDAEHPAPEDWAKWGCSAKQISEWLHEYCETATLLWGRKPVIYTYPWWWHCLSAADVSWAAPYALWMASYTHLGPDTPTEHEPPIPAPFRDWTVWQYSADGSRVRIPGITTLAVDRDCVRNEDSLLWLAGNDVEPDTLPGFAPVYVLPDPVRIDLPDPDDEPPEAA